MTLFQWAPPTPVRRWFLSQKGNNEWGQHGVIRVIKTFSSNKTYPHGLLKTALRGDLTEQIPLGTMCWFVFVSQRRFVESRLILCARLSFMSSIQTPAQRDINKMFLENKQIPLIDIYIKENFLWTANIINELKQRIVTKFLLLEDSLLNTHLMGFQ